ncbi:FHA domain-containing protein [Anaerolineales bacterium HSG25]|nr:FHA domain-containing protein [Anaerolineales bacterium HSG25]
MNNEDQEATMMGQSIRAKAVLVVRQGTQVGMSFPLSNSHTILGREEGINITLQDPEASRRHARVSWQGGQFVLEDLGSTNGTFINGIQITAPQVLNPGDSVGIGQTTLVFQIANTQGVGNLPQYPTDGGMQPAPAHVQPLQPAPTAYSPPPPPPQANKTIQYLLYSFGAIFMLGICFLLCLVGSVIANPQFFEQLLGL